MKFLRFGMESVPQQAGFLSGSFFFNGRFGVAGGLFFSGEIQARHSVRRASEYQVVGLPVRFGKAAYGGECPPERGLTPVYTARTALRSRGSVRGRRTSAPSGGATEGRCAALQKLLLAGNRQGVQEGFRALQERALEPPGRRYWAVRAEKAPGFRALPLPAQRQVCPRAWQTRNPAERPAAEWLIMPIPGATRYLATAARQDAAA